MKARPHFLRSVVARTCALALPASGPISERSSARARELRARGTTSLGTVLRGDQIDAVLASLDGKLLFEPWEKQRRRFLKEQLPQEWNQGHYGQEDILSAPHLLALANEPTLLETVASYLGCKPTLSNVALWWSFAGRAAPQEAQFFHRDRDDWRFLKLFVYLTDVDHTSGPHLYVEGSHRSMRLTGPRRYRDHEVAARFPGQAHRTWVGPRGLAFLEDTYGIHKGLLPRSRARLLFQAEYSLFPILQYAYAPSSSKRLAPGPALDPYVNRLLIDP